MQTPDPKNPQPGDPFIDDDGDKVTIIHVHDGTAWFAWDHDADSRVNGFASLARVATWTPVTPTPPDVWRTIHRGGGGTFSAAEHAIEHASHYEGVKVARYTFAEWVTP